MRISTDQNPKANKIPQKAVSASGLKNDLSQILDRNDIDG